MCLRCNAERGAARGALGDRHESWRTRELAALVDELDREDDELDDLSTTEVTDDPRG